MVHVLFFLFLSCLAFVSQVPQMIDKYRHNPSDATDGGYDEGGEDETVWRVYLSMKKLCTSLKFLKVEYFKRKKQNTHGLWTWIPIAFFVLQE